MDLLTVLLIAALVVEVFQHWRWKTHYLTLIFYMSKKEYDVPSKEELKRCRKHFIKNFRKK